MLKSLIVNIINANAPQLGCEAAVKEKYCLDLDTGQVFPIVKKILIRGDFNRNIGLDNEDF